MISPQIATDAPADAARALSFAGSFGWFHPATQGLMRKVGVVIVPGLGRDARCGHKPLRLLAESLADLGFPVLRYDHLGEGDSLPLGEGDEALAAWTQGVASAAKVLRDASGVDEVVLVGLRFGATLAALAQAEARGLVLLAPVILGRRWLRELKVAAAVGRTSSLDPADAFEAEGLSLAADTQARISAIDLTAVNATAPKVLMVAQTEASDLLGEHLKALGAEVTRSDFPGYEALFEDAHSNLPPAEVFGRVAAWLDANYPDLKAKPSAAPAAPAALVGTDFREEAVRFGPDLAGVICRPTAVEPSRRAAIICNTGGDPRAGIGGFSAAAARLLAGQGVATLRFDFAGLGDSPSVGPVHVYETSRTADLDAAIILMQAQGAEEIILIGACAGGYHALHYACRDPRVGGMFVINAAKMIWRPGDSLAIDKRDQGKSTEAYKQGVGRPETWLRLLRGQVDVVAVARTLLSRLASRWRKRANPEAEQLRADMAAFAARGGRAHLLMGVEDPSLDEVVTYFGPAGRDWRAHEGLTLSIRQGLDHSLARRFSRKTALAELAAFFQA
ncbi:alpha/beta fold hydrolase [Phenylobacterium aquaticum]|uniref:alpha/beta fold hydrolase n=1 Tax=Phenylobacterium aquaticum TaxID=1763816 RepID=UPI001F5DCE8A|nr:alpha/beta fold hydrolase [Phenylobacterium aquaticum]MCI3132694.1 alpha/beta fold hydrolase [Phenylobacterium aquaticum]